MRSADFKRTESKIRVLEEVRPQKKRINWDRLIYMGILLTGALTILFFLIRNNLYVRAEGQVLFRKLDIQFTQDIKIAKFKMKAGDAVEVGDTLFYYYDEDAIKPVSPTTVEEVILTNDNLEWIERERLTTLKRIELAHLRIKDFARLTDITTTEKDRVEKEVYLDIYPASKLDIYVHRLIDYDGKNAAAKEEIKFQKMYLLSLDAHEKLEREQLRLRNESMQQNWRPPVLMAHTSPVKGTITQIFKEDHEVALESDIVMAIHKATNLYVKAFYDQKDIKNLAEGDLVRLKFPDGTTSKGRVERFYVATYELPSEFQKKYEPLTRSIAADISPIDQYELERWKAFYKLNVRVSKPIYRLLEW